MIKDAPAFDFYPERWLVGVAALSDNEQLAYLRLLCHQWLAGDAGLVDDLAALKRLAGKGVTQNLLEKFPVNDDGKRRNPRLEIVRAEQRKRIEKRRQQRSDAALRRWHPEQCDSNAVALREHVRNGSGSNAHHPPPTTHPLKRESTASAPAPASELALQADAIAAAYPRSDDPLTVRTMILEELQRGTLPQEMREGVLRCVAFIRTAPGGVSNRYVPSARSFFERQSWRSPEGFEQRWQQPEPQQGKHPKGSREVSTVHTASRIPKL